MLYVCTAKFVCVFVKKMQWHCSVSIGQAALLLICFTGLFWFRFVSLVWGRFHFAFFHFFASVCFFRFVFWQSDWFLSVRMRFFISLFVIMLQKMSVNRKKMWQKMLPVSRGMTLIVSRSGSPWPSQAKVIQSQLGVGQATMGFDTKKLFASEVNPFLRGCFYRCFSLWFVFIPFRYSCLCWWGFVLRSGILVMRNRR